VRGGRLALPLDAGTVVAEFTLLGTGLPRVLNLPRRAQKNARTSSGCFSRYDYSQQRSRKPGLGTPSLTYRSRAGRWVAAACSPVGARKGERKERDMQLQYGTELTESAVPLSKPIRVDRPDPRNGAGKRDRANMIGHDRGGPFITMPPWFERDGWATGHAGLGSGASV